MPVSGCVSVVSARGGGYERNADTSTDYEWKNNKKIE